MSASSLAERWSLPTRVAFRFFFCFFLLFFFPFPFDLVPQMGELLPALWEPVVSAAAKGIFGVTVDATFNGSGDKTFHWVQLFVIVAASAIATPIWSIADRKRVAYPRLYPWFRVYVRFALAAAMIGYGAYKVIPSQFVIPPLERFVQPFGDASPMGLLWTFMGASIPYTVFTGIGELAGGLLLTMRRTTLLGALITAAVMTHVVVLNFTYDVPVKIYSTVLLLAALTIAAPDAKRLFDFFRRHPDPPLFERRRLRITSAVAALLFVATSLGLSFKQSYEQRTRMLAGRSPASSPIFGIWNVDDLTIDGVSHPPLTTDTTRWRRLVVSGAALGTIYNMDDTRTRFAIALDEKAGTLTFTKRTDPAFKAVFNVQRRDPNTMLLDGTFEGKKTTAMLRRVENREFLLTSRGFHWINEVPFNR